MYNYLAVYGFIPRILSLNSQVTTSHCIILSFGMQSKLFSSLKSRKTDFYSSSLIESVSLLLIHCTMLGYFYMCYLTNPLNYCFKTTIIFKELLLFLLRRTTLPPIRAESLLIALTNGWTGSMGLGCSAVTKTERWEKKKWTEQRRKLEKGA